MADETVKISEMTAETLLESNSLIEVSHPDPSGGYLTRSIRYDKFLDGIGAKQFLNEMNNASVLVNSGFGGAGTLENFRNGDVTVGAGYLYTTTPVGDYLGYQFASSKTIEKIRFFNRNAAGRIKDFKITRYNSGAWTKVPITGTGDTCSILNDDEARYDFAETADGWCELTFEPVADTRFAVHVLARSSVGDNNCGITEIEMYSVYYSASDGVHKVGDFTKDTGLLSVHRNTAQSTSGATTVLFNDVEWDTQSAYSASTGMWTAPRDMKISVNATVYLVSNTGNTQLDIVKNSTVTHVSFVRSFDGTAVEGSLLVSQGDTVNIQVTSDSNHNINGNAGSVYFQISEEIAGTFDPTNLITGAVELENDEYVCDGSESSVTLDLSDFDSDDLEIQLSVRSQHSEVSDQIMVRFNSDSGNNYDGAYGAFKSDNSIDYSSLDGVGISEIRGPNIAGGTLGSSYFSPGTIHMPNFKSTDRYKGCTITGSNYNGTLSSTALCGGQWRNTNAITSVTLYCRQGDFASGSRIKVYGKQTNAYPVVEGNEITVMQKIREVDIDSAVSSYTFSELDGDTDIKYKLDAHIVGDVGTSLSMLLLSFNGDTNASNYTTEILYGQNATSNAYNDSYGGSEVGYTAGAGRHSVMTKTIFARTGEYRQITGGHGRNHTGSAPTTQVSYGVWKNTTDNMTSMTISGDNVGNIGVGSHIELWAVRTIKVDATNNQQIAVFEDQQTSGTGGGTFTQDAWQTRVLNTTQNNDILNCSLSSNQITLPAGKYKIVATAPAAVTSSHQARLYNIIDSTDDILGTTEYVSSGVNAQTISIVDGVITITSQKVFELQHRCTSTKSGNGFGVAGSLGIEVYARIRIEKIG